MAAQGGTVARFRRLIGILLFVVLLVAAVLLRDANDQLVALDFVYTEVTNLPLWLVVLASFALGALAMALLLAVRLARDSLAQRRYRKAIAHLEAEVHQLRNLPIAEGGADADGALPARRAVPARADGGG